MCGRVKRLHRIIGKAGRPIILAPVDDSLLAGPECGLRDLKSKVIDIAEGLPDAVIGFAGVLQKCEEHLRDIPTILNLTASTTLGQHTRKVQTSDVEEALALGADGVAVHVNISSVYESQMLRILGRVAKDCRKYEMPLLGIMYPRREGETGDDNYYELKQSDVEAYTRLVRHAVRVGVELGVDIVKTQYTGSAESFRSVVESACGVPVFTAGGPMTNYRTVLLAGQGAISAGAAGISFGRNLFGRGDSRLMVALLRSVLNGRPVDEVLATKVDEGDNLRGTYADAR